jgi:cell division transport system ATP-binding protein
VLADEPTANLDEAYARDIMDMFRAFNEVGVTLVISTHDRDLIRRYGGRNVQLAYGKLVA